VAASFAALGDVIIAEPGALLSFSGPRVVKQTTRESLPDDFGLAESNYRHGHVDLIVPRTELRDTVARVVALLAGGTPYRPPSLVGDIDPVGAIGRALTGMRRRVRDANPFRNGGADVDD
jgi:acetyl-CoA carboxylase carboxyl transferase subunit beta